MIDPRPYDVVIITMSRWDGVYSSAIFSLAKELALSRRVFYIDHPFSFKDIARDWSKESIRQRRGALFGGGQRYRTIDGLPQNFIAVTPPATWPVNWLGPGGLYEQGSRRNDRILNETLQQLLVDHEVREYVFLNSFDPFFFREITAKPSPGLRIYQSRDDISQEAYIARHGVRLEQEQIKAADLALGTSRELCRKLAQSGKKVHYLPNAADTRLFGRAMSDKLNRPADLPAGRKIIGYTGNISSLRVDFDLLQKLALQHTDKDLVLVGELREEVTALEQLPNVHFLGAKKLEDLPSYLQHMDCTIIPFACNTLTKSIYPLKLNEYLAAGLPVVTTAFSEDLRDFADVAYLCESHDSFVEAISKAILEDNDSLRQTRAARASQNSWTHRARTFTELIEEQLGSPKQWEASSAQ